MIITFILFLIFIILFVAILFYKLADYNWHNQFFTQNFTDKDFFTKLIKFLMT